MVNKNEFSGILELFILFTKSSVSLMKFVLLKVEGDGQQSLKFQRCDS